MFEITSAPNLDRAEASDDHVFQYLLCQGAERVIRIGRIEIVSEDAYAQICIRQLFSASRPRLNSPAHSRDLVLDCVDRLPRHRRFSKTSQVGCRRLWVRIGPRTIGVQDGRQGHGSPLALRTSGQRHFCNPAHCAAQLLSNIHDFLYESVGQPAPLGYPMWRGDLCPRRIERERTYSVPFDEEPSIIYCETDRGLVSYAFNSRLISCAIRGISAAMVIWILLSRIIPSTKPISARSCSRSSSTTAINLAAELSRSRMAFAIPGKREASISP